MENKKQEAPNGVLLGIERQLEELKKLPPGPERDAHQQTLQEMAQFALEKYQLPAEAMAAEAPLVQALQYIPGVSYLPGIARTVVGEATLAGTNSPHGAIQAPIEAAKRVRDAVLPDFPFSEALFGSNPFSRGALSVGQYSDLLGNETKKRLDQTPIFKEKNAYLNPTYGGTIDTILGMGLDPAVIKNVLQKGPSSAVGKTAQEVGEEYANRVAKDAGMSGTQRFLQGAKNMVVDPTEQLSTMLRRSRFKEADKATLAAGKERFSDVFKREGIEGISRAGVEAGIKKALEESGGEIDAFMAKLEADNIVMPGASPRRVMSDLLEVLDSPEMKAKLTNAETNIPYQKVKSDIMKRFDLEASIKEPEQWARLQAEAGQPVIGRNGKPLFRETGPGDINLETTTKNKIVGKEPGPSTTKVELVPETGTRLRTVVKYYHKGKEVPAYDVSVKNGWAERVESVVEEPFTTAQTKYTTQPGEPKSIRELVDSTEWRHNSPDLVPELAPAPVSPALSMGGAIEYSPAEMGDKATNYGAKAANAGYFSKPTMFDTKRSAKALEKNAAEADVYNKLRGRSRDLQLEMLDEVGFGGPAKAMLGTESSLYEGGPFLNGQKFRGKYGTNTNRTYNALRDSLGKGGASVWGLVPEGTGDAAKLFGSKLLDTRGVKYVASPFVKSYINERAADSDRYKVSPWEFINELSKGKEP